MEVVPVVVAARVVHRDVLVVPVHVSTDVNHVQQDVEPDVVVDVMDVVQHAHLVDAVQHVRDAQVHAPEDARVVLVRVLVDVKDALDVVQVVRHLAVENVTDALDVVQVVHHHVPENATQHAQVHARERVQRHVPTIVLVGAVQRVPLNVVAHHPLQ